MNKAPHFAAHDLILPHEKVLLKMLRFQSEPSSEKMKLTSLLLLKSPQNRKKRKYAFTETINITWNIILVITGGFNQDVNPVF